MSVFPSFSYSARILRQLSALRPGEYIKIAPEVIADCTVPADPLIIQTSEFIRGWMFERLPFRAEQRVDLMTGAWIVRRLES